LGSEQTHVKKLLASAMQNAERDRLKEAAKKLQDARQIAGKTKNLELQK
jgi:hypothetical protein